MKILLFFFLFVSPSISFAEDIEHRDIVESLLKTMHVQQHMDDIPELVRSMVDQNQFTLEADGDKKLDHVFKEAYQGESIYELVVQDILDQTSKRELTRLKILLDSDVMQNILDLEKQISDPSVYQEFLQYTQYLQNNYPTEKRIQYLEVFDQAVQGISIFVDLNMSVYHTMIHSVNVLLQDEDKLSEERMKYLENEFWFMTQSHGEATLMMTYLFTYQDVLDEDLQVYISFLQQKDIQWFYKLYKDALFEALDICAEKVIYDLEEGR